MSNERIPWGINTIGSLYHPDVQAGLPDGLYVAAVCSPCPPSVRERFRAAWWVFTGRAHAFIWPKAGDLEAVWTRDNPTLRPSPRPFVPMGPQATQNREGTTTWTDNAGSETRLVKLTNTSGDRGGK